MARPPRLSFGVQKDDARKLDHATLEALRIRAVRSVQDGDSPEDGGPHVACHAAGDVSLAGALPSRWVERPEGEAAGGTAAKAGRRHAEMALPDGDPEEPAATEIPVRALDPGDGGRADRAKVWCPSGQELSGAAVGATGHHPAKAAVPGDRAG